MDFMASSEEIRDAEYTDIRLWYPVFSVHSIKTKIIDLPDRFSQYLLEDGIILPEEVGRVALGNDMLSDEENEGDPQETITREALPASFSDIDALIEATLGNFGGKIMVKVNDKAPTDAIWINCGTLMCNSVPSVYMLLKASERVCHSLHESGNYLVLRKWANMFPSMEFRCFVSQSCIIGISQKDVATFYPFLKNDSARIQDVILGFFDEKVKDKLLTASVVLDVYVDKQDRVWIVGFSPFGETSETDSFLFTWTELETQASRPDARGHDFESFRVVQTESHVLPRDTSVGASRGPSDFRLISEDIFSRNSKLLQGNASSSDSESEN